MSVLLRGCPHVNRAVDSHTFCVIPEAHPSTTQRSTPRSHAGRRKIGELVLVGVVSASLHDCANARLIGRDMTSMMPTRSPGGSTSAAASNRRHHAPTRRQQSSSPSPSPSPSPEQQHHPWRATALANTAAAPQSGSASSRRESVELLG